MNGEVVRSSCRHDEGESSSACLGTSLPRDHCAGIESPPTQLPSCRQHLVVDRLIPFNSTMPPFFRLPICLTRITGDVLNQSTAAQSRYRIFSIQPSRIALFLVTWSSLINIPILNSYPLL